jgi:hypothetical protein
MLEMFVRQLMYECRNVCAKVDIRMPIYDVRKNESNEGVISE